MIHTTKAIAANTDLVTAQAFVFFDETTYLLVIISGTGDDVFTKVRQLGVGLKDNFFDGDESVPIRLKRLGQSIITELTGVEELNVLLASISSSILYLESHGRHQAYLLRGERVLPLIDHKKDQQLISGYLHEQDRLVILSLSLVTHFADSPELATFLRTDSELTQEEIDDLIHNHPQLDPVAEIVVDYHPKDQIKELVEPSQPSFESRTRRLNIPRQFLTKLIHLRPNLDNLNFQISKKRLILAGILLVILIVIIGVIFKGKSGDVKQTRFKSLVSDAQSQLAQAESLKDLDTNTAKADLDKASTDLTQARDLFPKDSKINQLQDQINTTQSDVLKIYPINSLNVFLDLRLIRPNFFTKNLSFYNNEVLLLDETQKAVVLINLSKKSNQPLAGSEQLGTASQVSLNGQYGFVFSTDKGVFKIDTQNPKAQLAIKTDSDWGIIASIQGFASNVYLLDSSKNQIWKYLPTDNGFGDKIGYLGDGAKANFSDAKRMLIDSSIWVQSSSTEIDKYTQGQLDNFSVNGVPEPIKEITSFYVSDETDNFYILDASQGKLIKLTKTGQYLSQMTSDKLKNIYDFAVDEKGRVVYLLDGSTIYQVELK